MMMIASRREAARRVSLMTPTSTTTASVTDETPTTITTGRAMPATRTMTTMDAVMHGIVMTTTTGSQTGTTAMTDGRSVPTKTTMTTTTSRIESGEMPEGRAQCYRGGSYLLPAVSER
jgi:hypothetical protein